MWEDGDLELGLVCRKEKWVESTRFYGSEMECFFFRTDCGECGKTSAVFFLFFFRLIAIKAKKRCLMGKLGVWDARALEYE